MLESSRMVLALTLFLVPLTAFCSHARGKELEWIAPPKLRPGDTVMLVAPAGVANQDRVFEFKKILESRGYKAIVPDDLFRSDRYLAGSDEIRAAELNSAIRNPNVQAIFPCRGGYGLTRILDKIDYDALRKNPKLVIGFSDVTALHLAIAKKARLITLHSPMPQAYLFSDAPMHKSSNDLFWSFVSGTPSGRTELPFEISLSSKDRTKKICGGKAKGRLVGGNLTLICSTIGTPYAIEPKGKILVLEDTGEEAYRIDRYLSQLRLAGVLDQISGIVFGDFTDTDEVAMRQIIAEYIEPLGIPAVSGFPLGHEADNLTIPLGAMAELDADHRALRIIGY